MARGVAIASFVLMGAALLLVMLQGLLPGLLCVCLGFLLTRWLAPRLVRLRRLGPGGRGYSHSGQSVAAALVMLSPLLLIAICAPSPLLAALMPVATWVP